MGKEIIYFQFISFKRKKLTTSFDLKALKLSLINKLTQPRLDKNRFKQLITLLESILDDNSRCTLRVVAHVSKQI